MLAARRFAFQGDNVKFRTHLIFTPDSWFLSSWNIMIILLTLWTGFSIPFQVAFHTDAPWPVWMVALDTWCDIAFILDVLISFRTAYYRSIGTLESNWKKITSRYLHTWCIVDIAGAIPLEKFVSSQHVHVIGMFRMARLVRFGRLIKLMEYLKFSSLGGILQLYVLVFLISHWLACG